MANPIKRSSAQVAIPAAKRFKLIKASTICTDVALQTTDEENPFKLEFYCDESTYLIPYKMRIKKAFDQYDQSWVYWFARLGDASKYRKDGGKSLSVMKFSTWEGKLLMDELEKFYKSFQARQEEGGMGLIDYFDADPARAYQWEDKKWTEFFESPDLELSNIKVRFGHTKANNRYTMFMFSLVPESKRIEGWSGPIFFCSAGGMLHLLEYLRMTQEEHNSQLSEETQSAPELDID